MGQFLFYSSNLLLIYYYNDVSIKYLQLGLNFIYLFIAPVWGEASSQRNSTKHK